MDDMDRAQAINEEWLDLCLEQQRRNHEVGATGRSTLHGTMCIDCEEPIPAARLAVHPNADRCVQCQSEFELLSRRPL